MRLGGLGKGWDGVGNGLGDVFDDIDHLNLLYTIVY